MPWHCKPYYGYLKESTEAKDNAIEIAEILHRNGWTVNAIAGMLGNVGNESAYNPWLWEMQQPGSTEPDILASTDTELIANSNHHGYGLFQFTPAGKYIYDQYAQSYQGYGPNFSDIPGSYLDGQAQVIFVHYHADYAPTPTYPYTYQEYKESDDMPEYLAAVWFFNYERGAAWGVERATDARYWYDFLVDYFDDDTKKKKWKWIYYLKRRRF